MMSSTQNFTEWTREQKEEYAKKRMKEMKLKNEKMMQRYAEVQQDRITAEEHNSAITNAPKILSKKENPNESGKTDSKKEYTREWDRGKPDKEHWKSPEHHTSYMNYRTSHFEKKCDKKDNWHNYSRKENIDQYRYNHASDSMQDRKTKGNSVYKHHESSKPHVANSFCQRPEKSRCIEHQNDELQWKSYQSYAEKYKTADYKASNSKRYSNKEQSYDIRDANYVDNMQFSLRASLWENDKICEDENKHNRVEKWVKSVNKSNNWVDKQLSSEEKSKISPKSGGKFEHSSDQNSGDEYYMKNSWGENKFQKNNNCNVSKMDSYEIKQYSRERSDRRDPINTNQSNKKFYKNNIHNSEYSSSGSNKNENFRRQKFDNKSMRNGRERFSQSKMGKKSASFNDGWDNSEYSQTGSTKLGPYNRDSKSSKDGSLYKNNDDDTWGISSQNISTPTDDTWGISSQNISTPTDDTWGISSQNISTPTDDTWGISSQNISTPTDDTWGISSQNISTPTDDTWSSTTVNIQTNDTWGTTVSNQDDADGIWANVVRNQNNVARKNLSNDDGMWSNAAQSDIQWNLSDDETDSSENRFHKQRKCVNKNIAQRDGCKDNESFKDAINKLNKDSGFNSKITENISVSNLKSPVDKTAAKSTVKYNTTKKNFNLPDKNQNDSDDGGWSTVSEEGEIH